MIIILIMSSHFSKTLIFVRHIMYSPYLYKHITCSGGLVYTSEDTVGADDVSCAVISLPSSPRTPVSTKACIYLIIYMLHFYSSRINSKTTLNIFACAKVGCWCLYLDYQVHVYIIIEKIWTSMCIFNIFLKLFVKLL